MMKSLATAPLEQESESSTIVFLLPDDVLRMPWHTGYRGRKCMLKRSNVLRFKETKSANMNIFRKILFSF